MGIMIKVVLIFLEGGKGEIAREDPRIPQLQSSGYMKIKAQTRGCLLKEETKS
jgi:hypothetical protein